MENPERKMDSRNKNKKIKPYARSKERLTIMVFGCTGKIRSFKISPRLLFWASLFFSICIVAFVFLANKCFDFYMTNRLQTDIIDDFERQLMKKTSSLERLKREIALLNDCVAQGKKVNYAQEMPVVSYSESVGPELIDIEELDIGQDKTALTVNFKIVNRKTNAESAEGYIFILAGEKESDEPEFWIYPHSPIHNGLPVNYKAGQHFLIQRYKKIRSAFALIESMEKPLLVQILVYDSNGRLILRRVADV